MAGRPDHIQKLSLLVQANTTQLKGELAKLRRQFMSTNQLAKQMGGIIAGAFGVREMVRFTKEAVVLAGRLKGVEQAFSQIAGSQRLMQKLREETKGMVSDLELMSTTNLARKLGIAVSQLPTLLGYARRVAKETGLEVDYLVNSIVTGIGRKSPRILDNLGISTTRLKEAMGGLSMEAATVQQVTEAVGSIIQQEMEDAGEEVITTADRFQQLTVRLENLKAEIGEKLTPVTLEFFEALNNILTKLNEIDGWKGAIEFTWKDVGGFFAKYSVAGLVADSLSGKNITPTTEDYASNPPASPGLNFPKFVKGKGGGTPEESISRMNTELERLSSISAELPGAGENGILGGALLGPNPELVGESMTAFNERLLEVVNNVQGAAGIIGQGFQDVFGQFASAFVSGKNVLSQMLDYFKKWAAAMIAKLLAVAAAAFILSRLFPGLGAIMGSAKGLSGFKGVFQGLGGFGGGVEAFKNIKGGMGLVATVTGDQLNFVMSEYNRKRSTTY